MTQHIEYERTFLASRIPENLEEYPCKEFVDFYIPITSPHPSLRIRKKGNTFEMTKKTMQSEDASEQMESTISLSKEEFEALSQLPAKKVFKKRYYYPYNQMTAEIDVFQEELSGLVVVDFEFSDSENKKSFTPPDYCLVDVTPEEFIAGGYLAGKKYGEIEEQLKKYYYKKLI